MLPLSQTVDSLLNNVERLLFNTSRFVIPLSPSGDGWPEEGTQTHLGGVRSPYIKMIHRRKWRRRKHREQLLEMGGRLANHEVLGEVK